MPKQKIFLTWGAILFFLFFLFSFFIHFGRFVETDFQITLFLQSIFPRIVDTPFSLFSLIGSLEFVSLILLLIWAILRKLNYIIVLGFFGLMHVIELIGKAFVYHPQPPFKYFRYDLGVLFPSSYIQPGSSYPSGHASRTAFLVILILVLLWNSKKFTKDQKIIITIVLGIFSIVMFVSRIYLGEHWTSDVVGGILIGGSFGLISSYFLLSEALLKGKRALRRV